MAAKERTYKAGGSDPRTGPERLAGVINKGLARSALKKQDRNYDDTPAKMAKNVKLAASSRPKSKSLKKK
jgi:hypothetical protein